MEFELKDGSDCIQLLLHVQRSMSRSTIPEEYIKEVFHTSSQRTAVKRLREKVISAGYQLILMLDDAIQNESYTDSFMFRENVIVLWNHLHMHIDRLGKYVEENANKIQGEA